MFVYLITNTVNGKSYVGQTTRNLTDRWRQHCKQSNCRRLCRAISKYGSENFFMESIIEVDSQDLADEFEKEYILRYRTLSPNGYNLTTGGAAPKPSLSTRLKMSLSHKGERPPSSFSENWTQEQGDNARLRMLGNSNLLGHKTSLETRRKISESMKLRRKEVFWSTRKKI